MRALLEKVQPELITLDPTKLGEVDVPTMEEKVMLIFLFYMHTS